MGAQVLGLILAAALQAVALAWPFPTLVPGWLQAGQPSGLLQVLALAVLCSQLQGRPVFWRTWLFATAWLCATFWWLFISMHTYGGMPAAVAVLAVLALALALGAYYALALAALVRLCPGVQSTDKWPLVFASAWTLAELIRGQWFTGFPWGAIGYAHVDSVLGVLAPWVGVYGMGWLAAWLAAWLVQWGLPERPASRRQAWAIGIFFGFLSLHAWLNHEPWGESAGMVPVTLLQGNIPQQEKFEASRGVATALDWYAQAIADAKGLMVVAPETAVPLLPSDLPESYLTNLIQSLSSAQGEKAVMLGLPLGDSQQGYTNSVVGLNRHSDMAKPQSVYRYNKHHLVPFGEFIPPLFRWFTRLMHIPLGDFERGERHQVPFQHAGQYWAANICYEDLFGEELAANFAGRTAWPTVMVNFSNIAWFGDSVAMDQHLNISRMRAMEFRRPMIRSTNTGATAIIDHEGTVQAILEPYRRAKIEAVVQARSGRRTPFAVWASVFGLWPVWVFCLALLVGVCMRHHQCEKSRENRC